MKTIQPGLVAIRDDRREPQKTRRDNANHRDRKRGVILTSKGWHKLQQAMQAAEAEHNWGKRFTREQLSDRTALSLNTISRILKRSQAVDRLSLEYFLRGFGLQLSPGDCAPPRSPFEELAARQANQNQDWREAIDVSVFYGHEQEILQLGQWILEDRCRLVVLLGSVEQFLLRVQGKQTAIPATLDGRLTCLIEYLMQ
jgi:hypothetical protein